MCGRFALHSKTHRIAAATGLSADRHGDFVARYNVAPSQPVVNVQQRLGSRSIETYVWGFLPHWAHGGKLPKAQINARGETVATSGMFRAAFAAQRSVIPADGFYEWQQIAGRKVPHYIHRQDGELLLFAGIFDRPVRLADRWTCAILTCPANALLARIHNTSPRMPVILPRRAVDAWLDPATPLDHLQKLLRPAPDSLLEAWPVSAAVNRPQNDGPELVDPCPDAPP